MFQQKIEVDNSRIAQVLKPVQAAKPVRQQNLRRSPRSDSWHTCAHTGQQSSQVMRGFGEQLAVSFKRDHPRYFDGVNYFDFVEGVEGRIQTTQLRPKFSLRRALLLGVTAFLPLSFAQTAQAQETTPVAAGPTGTPAPTAPVITSCSYGELFEFDNSGSIVFSANPSNNQLFTAQSVQNGTTFDFTILDRSPSSNPLLTPLSGTAHNQSGGTATNGGIRILATANSALSSEVDITVGMSGGFATELEFYVHDIEVTENAVFGATDFVAGSLGAHPGATLNIDQSTNKVIATAANTDGESNRSALATYQNINGLTSLTQTHTISSRRLGTGFALGSYCVSQVEAVTETFPAVTGAGGVTASVLTSDTLNGEILDPADVNFTLGAITGPDGNPSTAITLNADRTVTVPAGTAPGDYTVEYEFCDTVNPTNCDTAIETITVTAPILPPPLPPLNPGVCGGVLAEVYLLDGMGIGSEQQYQLASGSFTHDPDAFFGIFGTEPAYTKNAAGSVTYYFDGEDPLQSVSTDVNTPAAIGNITSVNGNAANQTDAAEFWRITARVDGVPGQTYNYTLDNGGAHEFLHYWLEDSAGNIIDSSLDDPNTANGWLYGTGQTYSTSSKNGATSISASRDTPISYTIPASSPDGIVYLRVMVLDPQAAWGNLNFTNAPSCSTELLANKTMAVYDPTNTGLYSIPGNDVIYTFTISNDGNGAVDADTIKLLDILPPEFDFWNGDIDDGGPESFPVTFAQTVGTGMSLTYATDIRFGTGSTPPANFDACSTVAPDSSYRQDLTYICFNPKGVLSAGDPNPTIELKFRGRIK